MAANTNKRTAIRYIRDGIKQQYKKGDCCEICGTGEDLEFHHYHTVAYVLENYAKELGLSLATDEQVLAMRDDFYKTHWHELVDDAVTLCNKHHIMLHGIYGQKPLLSTVEKQRNWVKKMHDKVHGVVEDEVLRTTGLSQYVNYNTTSLLDFLV